MPNLIFNIGKLSITPFHWCLVLAFIVFSFTLWRRMKKEDYDEDDIFNLAVILLVSALVFGRFFSIYLKIPLLGAFWGTILIAIWRFKILNKSFWEGLDCLSQPMFYFFTFGGIGGYLTTGKWLTLFYSLIGIIGILLYTFLKKKYRRFSWYKSGKTGFLFWTLSFYLSLTLLVLDFFQNNGLYLQKVLWLVSIIVSVLVIRYRAELNKFK